MNEHIGIRFLKMHPDFKAPEYKTPGAAGFDLVALDGVWICPGRRVKIPLGFAIEIPPGYQLEIRPRSGNTEKGLDVFLGTVDSDYRGEVAAIVGYTCGGYSDGWTVKAGARIAQGVIVPVLRVNFLESYELSETQRGAGGFGSTGK